MSRASKQLIAVGTALLLAMVVAVGLAIWNMRVAALQEARMTDAKLGIAIAEQTARSIQAIDLILLQICAEIEPQSDSLPGAFRSAFGTRAMHQELNRLQHSLPQSAAFGIVGPTGELVNSSRHWPVPRTDLSDRGYFLHFSKSDDPNALIAPVMRSRIDNHWSLYVVRRLNDDQGRFLGLVIGVMNLAYFQDFYQSLVTTSGDLDIALLDPSGRLVISYPNRPALIGQRLDPSDTWAGIVAGGHNGSFEASGVLRPGRRLISVNPLHEYPLVVDVSTSKAQSLARWREQATLTILGTGCAVLCFALLLRALTLQLRRLERSETSLAESSSVLRMTLDHIDQGICMVDGEDRVTVWNRRALQLLDLPAGALETRPLFNTVLGAMEAGRDRVSTTDEWVRPNGTILEVRSTPLPQAGAVFTYADVTARRRDEDRIRHLAHHDPLTGLANRTLLQQGLMKGIAQARATGGELALLYLDLDGFKLVNDTRGHATGDALLLQVAQRLLAATSDRETVARTGGDEFAIAMPVDGQPRTPGELARDIIALIKMPFVIDGASCRISVSIGIARYPDHATEERELQRNADIALYKAKAEGSDRFCFFDSGLRAQQQRRSILEQDLRLALDRHELSLVYQPILETQSGQMAGCEALLRWHHPTHGQISPAEFIPLAEKHRQIVPIGLWVLEQACAEAAQWPNTTHVAVNLSPVQMGHETIIADVREILARTGLPPGRLVLEVTEGLLLDESRAVLSTMQTLRDLGIRFSLDDFGTGHSGLGYLRRFPFDGIKIDKLFVQDMVDQPDADAIVGALLAVSVALNLDVIAEGVETEAQLVALSRRRCRHVQGYLIGRPVPAAEIRPRMMASHRVSA